MNEYSVRVMMDAAVFKRFVNFDTFIRRRMWIRPLIFTLIMLAFAGICLAGGSVLLTVVLGLIALSLPIVYWWTFRDSLKKQIVQLKLEKPREAYTLLLNDNAVHVSHGDEKADYQWSDCYGAYRDRECTYLYITAARAFLLPDKDVGDADGLWAMLKERLGEQKTHVIKQRH